MAPKKNTLFKKAENPRLQAWDECCFLMSTNAVAFVTQTFCPRQNAESLILRQYNYNTSADKTKGFSPWSGTSGEV